MAINIHSVMLAVKMAVKKSKDYVSGHFVAGTNITITDNHDGTQTIAASGEVSSEDTVAREAIQDILDGTTLDSFGDVETALSGKVDKVEGKGLSTEDYTSAEKEKLAGIGSGAEANVQSDWNQSNSAADDFIKNKPLFNTAYDASTNKVATMADIEKGLLSSYTKKTGNVATTDKVGEAIGKLETKADTNENNIELLEKYGGGKNLLNNVATEGSSGTLSWTVASDKSVSLSGSTNAANTRITLGTFTPKSGVQYVLSGCPSDGSAETFRIYGVNGNDTRLPDYGEGYIFTGDGTEYMFYVYINNSGTNMNGKVFKPMICSTADWALSHDYQPYALPNTKITPELIELVDSGAKNICNWHDYTLTSTTHRGVSFTNNNNGTVTVNTDSQGSTEADAYANLIAIYTGLPFGLKVGDTIVFASSSDKVKMVLIPYMTDHYGTSEVGTKSSPCVYTIPQGTTGMVVRFTVRDSGTVVNNESVYGFICTKSAWDVSQKFVPYRPTYAETVAQVAENETNILLINNFKYQDITIKLSELTWTQGGSGEYYSSAVSVPNATEIVSIMWITDSYIRDTDRITPHVISSDRSKIGLYASTDTFANQNATVSFLILYK